MTEFKYDVKGTKHKIVIVAEDEEKANERFELLFGKIDDN